MASIPAPSNALGNLNADHFINLIDLLRLQDIANRIGAAPTAQELAEGDLDGNGTIDPSDVRYLREILLRQRGLVYRAGKTSRGAISAAESFSPPIILNGPALDIGDFESGAVDDLRSGPDPQPRHAH